jgi:hypothetical protein
MLGVFLLAAIVPCEVSAQGSTGPEQRLKEKKIVLPPAEARRQGRGHPFPTASSTIRRRLS